MDNSLSLKKLEFIRFLEFFHFQYTLLLHFQFSYPQIINILWITLSASFYVDIFVNNHKKIFFTSEICEKCDFY